ncbi:MAG: hypothetical protein IKD68_14845 [Solobacterium sp.]|nr:hypothetical protein [Solobacterium sp.]
MNKTGISTADVLRKAGHVRMIQNKDNIRELQNTRAKDLELMGEPGFQPTKFYNPAGLV